MPLDPDVLAAMRRWPNVPAVHGWLSLDARGRWQLHEDGLAHEGGAGAAISNPRILAFIGRNYMHDGRGGWYFQNGPQRVYVRLDAAPHVLRLAGDGQSLETHTGLVVREPRAWWLDDAGNLYAATEHGPGRVLDRDLAAVAARLRTGDGRPLLDALEDPAAGASWPATGDMDRDPPPKSVLSVRYGEAGPAAPLRRCAAADIARLLEFDPDPRPSAAAGPGHPA